MLLREVEFLSESVDVCRLIRGDNAVSESMVDLCFKYCFAFPELVCEGVTDNPRQKRDRADPHQRRKCTNKFSEWRDR